MRNFRSVSSANVELDATSGNSAGIDNHKLVAYSILPRAALNLDHKPFLDGRIWTVPVSFPEVHHPISLVIPTDGRWDSISGLHGVSCSAAKLGFWLSLLDSVPPERSIIFPGAPRLRTTVVLPMSGKLTETGWPVEDWIDG